MFSMFISGHFLNLCAVFFLAGYAVFYIVAIKKFGFFFNLEPEKADWNLINMIFIILT